MSFTAEFWASGKPATKGNHTAFCAGQRRCKYRPVVTEKSKRDASGTSLKQRMEAWQKRVVAAGWERKPDAPLVGGVAVEVTLFFRRPPSNRDPYPSATNEVGDADKYARAIGDALQLRCSAGGRYMRDDSQIVDLVIRKRWAGERGPGALIAVEALEPQPMSFPEPKEEEK